MKQIDLRILMATYNGELWIGEQLDSLFNQTNQGWKLFIRDDSSTDGTLKILERWKSRYPDRIDWYSGGSRLGPSGSFSELMENNKSADYLMFCDQDDVWAKEKVQVCLDSIVGLETKYGERTPLLVHHDLTVCDQSLIPIDPSFMKFQALNPTKNSLSRLLLQNVVTGCTVIINQALARKTGRVPKEAIMHDWWLALVASGFGHIQCIYKPELILYRIHGNNTCGTAERALSWSHIKRRLFNRTGLKLHELLKPYYTQAHVFLNTYNLDLSEAHFSQLEAFIALPNQNWFRRRRSILKHNFWKQEWVRNVAWLLRA